MTFARDLANFADVSANNLIFRNSIINGAMQVSQRATSFTSTGSANNDDVYTLDRWTLLSDGNDAVDVTQATDAPTGFKYSCGLVIVRESVGIWCVTASIVVVTKTCLRYCPTQRGDPSHCGKH